MNTRYGYEAVDSQLESIPEPETFKPQLITPRAYASLVAFMGSEYATWSEANGLIKVIATEADVDEVCCTGNCNQGRDCVHTPDVKRQAKAVMWQLAAVLLAAVVLAAWGWPQ